VGPITQYVENMANRNIDELVLLDIYASLQNREPDFKRIRKFTDKLMCPVAYGGGISSIDHVKKLIQECGIDKVILKSNYHLIEEITNKLGAQSVVYNLCCYPHHSDGTYFIDGVSRQHGFTLWAEEIQRRGAGELIVTAIHRQGMMLGYSTNAIRMISKYVTIPLIANGGCGNVNHMVEAIKAGADAVAAGTVFCLRSLTPQEAARGLQEAGLPSRVG
jgi:cyclase